MEFAAGDYFVCTWRTGDETALAKHANNRNIWRNLWDRFPHPYTMDDAIAWVEAEKDRVPPTNFAITDANEAIGAIGLTVQDDVNRRSAEVGYWLAEPFWGRGIATHALRALVDYAFANFDLVRLYAEVKEWNPASTRVLEKCGFTFEGRLRKSATKDGHTIDQLLYALVRT